MCLNSLFVIQSSGLIASFIIFRLDNEATVSSVVILVAVSEFDVSISWQEINLE